MDQSNRNECDKKSPITGSYDATYHTCPLYSGKKVLRKIPFHKYDCY